MITKIKFIKKTCTWNANNLSNSIATRSHFIDPNEIWCPIRLRPSDPKITWNWPTSHLNAYNYSYTMQYIKLHASIVIWNQKFYMTYLTSYKDSYSYTHTHASCGKAKYIRSDQAWKNRPCECKLHQVIFSVISSI